jgi:glyoxylase-like metal-dependent hydrolase (beta-lactamase superfamily II)
VVDVRRSIPGALPGRYGWQVEREGGADAVGQPPTRRITVGDATVTLVPDGRFRLDGGAMFGVVPRVVWERRTPADDQHRVQLAFNAMLIETAGVHVLVDPGLGWRYDASFARRFHVEQPPSVYTSLRRLGVEPEQIDVVVNTHLHWDHAGANTALAGAVETGRAAPAAPEAPVVPAFPKARYIVQRREWDDALHPHERSRASYRPDDFLPLRAAGLLHLADGEADVAPGVRVLPVGGHAPGMQLVRLTSAGATFLHLADLVPTHHHLDYAWIMGYDLCPVRTLEQKKHLLPRAAEEGWVVGFVHDPDMPFARLRMDGARAVADPVSCG